MQQLLATMKKRKQQKATAAKVREASIKKARKLESERAAAAGPATTQKKADKMQPGEVSPIMGRELAQWAEPSPYGDAIISLSQTPASQPLVKNVS